MTTPVVLIIEPRKEVAAALASTIALSNLSPVVVPHLERLNDIPHSIAAIVVRVSFEGVGDPPHSAILRLPHDHPPVIAIAWEEDELEGRPIFLDVSGGLLPRKKLARKRRRKA